MEDALTLRTLHQRLGELIKHNEESGQGVRNDLPAYFEYRTRTPTGRLRASTMIPVHGASSSMLGWRDEAGEHQAMTLFNWASEPE